MFKIGLLSTITILIFEGCSNLGSIIPTSHNNRITSNSRPYIEYREQMLSYVNKIRAEGAKCAPPAPPLQLNKNLEASAMSHTKDMAINHYLKHYGSGTSLDEGKPENAINSTFIDRITYFGYPVKPNILVGENITYTKFKNTKTKELMPNFKKAVDNWLHDQEHCKIFMNPRFAYMGLAYKKTDDRYYFTMNLAQDSNY